MTNYELEKLTKGIAAEIIRKATEDERFLDLLFPPRILNLEEASAYTKIPKNTLYTKISSIPHMKKGKRLLFSERSLYRWMWKGGKV